jgi:hypothetical protein
MSGGANQYVMGSMTTSGGAFNISNSGFGYTPEAKYYDSYAYDSVFYNYNRGHLGDATREILKQTQRGWYNDITQLPYDRYPWIVRAGIYNGTTGAGIFHFESGDGTGHGYVAFHSIITAQ